MECAKKPMRVFGSFTDDYQAEPNSGPFQELERPWPIYHIDFCMCYHGNQYIGPYLMYNMLSWSQNRCINSFHVRIKVLNTGHEPVRRIQRSNSDVIHGACAATLIVLKICKWIWLLRLSYVQLFSHWEWAWSLCTVCIVSISFPTNKTSK